MAGPRAPAYRSYDNYRNNYPPVRGIPCVDCDDGLWDIASEAFYQSWNSRLDKAPQIVRVLDVGKSEEGSRINREDFHSCKDGIEYARRYKRDWYFDGNEKHLFHGTTRLCRLGNPTRRNGTHVDCCPNPECNVCSIIQDNFDMDHARERRKRFGNGIYFTENSSRAIQDEFQGRNSRSARGKHASTIEANGRYRAVLLCRVLTGRPWNASGAPMGAFEKPPRGFDSIVAQYNMGSGRNENGDNETVIYDSHAVLPWLLIIVDPDYIETEHYAIQPNYSPSLDGSNNHFGYDSDDNGY